MVKKEIVIKELKKIAKNNNGVLQPEEVVEFARDEKSLLHSLFDWNNSVAGHNWRVHQARMLIRVSVQYLEGKGQKPFKVFVSLSQDRYKGEGGYRTLESVMSNKQFRAILLQDALSEMELFRDKFYKLKELSDVFKAMNKVRIKIAPKQKGQIKVTAKV